MVLAGTLFTVWRAAYNKIKNTAAFYLLTTANNRNTHTHPWCTKSNLIFSAGDSDKRFCCMQIGCERSGNPSDKISFKM